MTAITAHGRCPHRRTLALAIAALGWLAACGMALAHANGMSYLHVAAADDGNAVTVVWEIDASDLQLPLELDRNGDGVLVPAEIQARRAAIEQFAVSRLVLDRGGRTCALSAVDLAPIERDATAWVRLSLAGACSAEGRLSVSTSLFFGSPGYSALIDADTRAGRFAAALSMAGARWTEPARASIPATLRQFTREGIRHVLIGYDHVAFLLLLVLPSVLRRTGSGWLSAIRRRDVLVDLMKTVTGFTLAHSVTLALAATGAVRIAEAPIEAAIAGSIVVAGLLNLVPAPAGWRLGLAIGFGFVHGFGFANALQGIGGEGLRIVPMLAGFNLGIECAQLLLVAALLPLLWMLSRWRLYATLLMPGLSVATALTGAVWFAARL